MILQSLYRGTCIISVSCVCIVGVFQTDVIYVESAINRTSIASDARLTICVDNTAFIYKLYNLFIYTFIYHCYLYLLYIPEIFLKYPEYLLSIFYPLNISNFAPHENCFLQWETFPKIVVEKIKMCILCSITLFRKSCVYEIMWKNIVEPKRSQMTVWRMRIACCIQKATNTHLEYALAISLPLLVLFTFVTVKNKTKE